MVKKGALVFFLAFVVVHCAEADDVYKKCGANVACIEQQIMGAIDEVDQDERLAVLGHAIVIEKSKEARSYGDKKPSSNVIDRILRYVDEHQLKVNFPMNFEAAERAISDSRSSKIKKVLLPILLLLKLKAAIVIPAVISAVALVAFKGLGVSLIALVFSAVAAFKAAVDASSSSTSKFSYEIVPQVPASPWSRTANNHLENWTANQPYHTIP